MTSSPRRAARFALLVSGLGFASIAAPARGEDAPAPTSPPAPTPAPPPAPVPTPAPAPPPPAPAGPRPIPPPLRVGREQMWPAPTAADWEKPCLLTWQRTYEDAVAVSKETGRPILLCINMDGEIASEHYAGVRYRDPAIAALYEPYVCVIASVYRHTPKDHDDEGRRIPCPRFGGVTCGEHIAMELAVYERHEKGQRVAPRHIGIETDGKEMFDVFYRNDTASVFADIRAGIANRPPPPPAAPKGDRPLADRVGSRAKEDREAVEAAYRDGTPERRRELLAAARKASSAAPVDLLRLAIFGVDPDAAKAAREALATIDDPAAAELVGDALRAPMDAPERDALLGALDRMGTTSPRARWLAVVHRGLTGTSKDVDAKGWLAAKDASRTPPASIDAGALEAAIVEKEAAAKADPKDVGARLELAESALVVSLVAPRTYTTDPRASRSFAKRMNATAERAATEAEALGAKGFRVDAVLALAAYYDGRAEAAYPRAQAAARTLPPGAVDWASMAVLQIFAESRWKAIRKAVREGSRWPPEWLADVHAAHAVLLAHPLGSDDQVAWHVDFLAWLGAHDQARRVLDAGLARFRESTALHERWRERLLAAKGPEGLEAAYEPLLAAKDVGPATTLLAARASVVAADQLRRTRRFVPALAAYERAIRRYEDAAVADPAYRDAAIPAIALAHAGRARVAWQLGDDETAATELLASFARSPESAGTSDGMGITPGETGQMLLARLKEAKKDDLALRIEKALASLDQELLRPDRNN